MYDGSIEILTFTPSYPANPPVEPACDVDGLTMVGTAAPGGGSPVPCVCAKGVESE